MQIALKPEQEQFIIEKLNQGNYQNIDELLTVAFRLLEEHEKKK
jgi:antitoxin ParD1/3/4